MKGREKRIFPASRLSALDGELLKACRQGDQSAWDKLVDRYQRLIATIPRRAGLPEEDVADIFQEVFLTLIEKLDEIKEPEKLRAWIITTTKFKTWQMLRRARGMTFFENDEKLEQELEALPDNSPLADEKLMELEEQHLIRMALSELDQRCQLIIKMLYYERASYSDVAKFIGVNETSISPLRSRCLQKLLKILKS
jgi:RNA polymerase sigma factor (sigma-70 family)